MKLLYQLIFAGTTMHGLCHAATIEVKTNAEKKNSAAKNMQQWELKFFDGMFFISDKAIGNKAIERENRTACIATAFDKLPKEKLLQMPQCIEPMIAKKYLQQHSMQKLEFIRKNKMQLLPAIVPTMPIIHANCTQYSRTIPMPSQLLEIIARYHRLFGVFKNDHIPSNLILLDAYFGKFASITEDSAVGSQTTNDTIKRWLSLRNLLFIFAGYQDQTIRWYIPTQKLYQLLSLPIDQLQLIARLFHMYQRGRQNSYGIILEKTGTMIFSNAESNENDDNGNSLYHPVIRLSQEDTKVFSSLPKDLQNNLRTSYKIQLNP